MSKQVAGVGLMVAAFTQEEAGKVALKAMEKAQKEKRVFFDAAAVITQSEDGEVHFNETDDMKTGEGAGWGAVVGGVIGILGGPVGIAAGAGIGAAIGGAASHGDAGFSDDSLEKFGSVLNPGTSALITINNKDFLKTMREGINEEELQAVVSKIAEQISSQLNEGKDVIEYLIIGEDGSILQESTADQDTIKVITTALQEG